MPNSSGCKKSHQPLRPFIAIRQRRQQEQQLQQQQRHSSQSQPPDGYRSTSSTHGSQTDVGPPNLDLNAATMSQHPQTGIKPITLYSLDHDGNDDGSGQGPTKPAVAGLKVTNLEGMDFHQASTALQGAALVAVEVVNGFMSAPDHGSRSLDSPSLPYMLQMLALPGCVHLVVHVMGALQPQQGNRVEAPPATAGAVAVRQHMIVRQLARHLEEAVEAELRSWAAARPPSAATPTSPELPSPLSADASTSPSITVTMEAKVEAPSGIPLPAVTQAPSGALSPLQPTVVPPQPSSPPPLPPPPPPSPSPSPFSQPTPTPALPIWQLRPVAHSAVAGFDPVAAAAAMAALAEAPPLPPMLQSPWEGFEGDIGMDSPFTRVPETGTSEASRPGFPPLQIWEGMGSASGVERATHESVRSPAVWRSKGVPFGRWGRGGGGGLQSLSSTSGGATGQRTTRRGEMEFGEYIWDNNMTMTSGLGNVAAKANVSPAAAAHWLRPTALAPSLADTTSTLSMSSHACTSGLTGTNVTATTATLTHWASQVGGSSLLSQLSYTAPHAPLSPSKAPPTLTSSMAAATCASGIGVGIDVGVTSSVAPHSAAVPPPLSQSQSPQSPTPPPTPLASSQAVASAATESQSPMLHVTSGTLPPPPPPLDAAAAAACNRRHSLPAHVAPPHAQRMGTGASQPSLRTSRWWSSQLPSYDMIQAWQLDHQSPPPPPPQGGVTGVAAGKERLAEEAVVIQKDEKEEAGEGEVGARVVTHAETHAVAGSYGRSGSDVGGSGGGVSEMQVAALLDPPVMAVRDGQGTGEGGAGGVQARLRLFTRRQQPPAASRKHPTLRPPPESVPSAGGGEGTAHEAVAVEVVVVQGGVVRMHKTVTMEVAMVEKAALETVAGETVIVDMKEAAEIEIRFELDELLQGPATLLVLPAPSPPPPLPASLSIGPSSSTYSPPPSPPPPANPVRCRTALLAMPLLAVPEPVATELNELAGDMAREMAAAMTAEEEAAGRVGRPGGVDPCDPWVRAAACRDYLAPLLADLAMLVRAGGGTSRPMGQTSEGRGVRDSIVREHGGLPLETVRYLHEYVVVYLRDNGLNATANHVEVCATYLA